MLKDWQEITRNYTTATREVRNGAPDVMRSFGAIAQAAMKPGALEPKTKELVALAISVAIRCDPCIGFHAEGAVKQGASRAEVLETIGTAIYMGTGPSAMYAAAALEAYDQFAAARAAAAD